ncbi:hypothetical protein [Microbacterium aurantiacum]|uniref:hypothetical protein n=1 Tax=Microbacterium aurantiacum TaxID=162393 RepID=UPI003F498391
MPYDSKYFGDEGIRLIRIRDVLGASEPLYYGGPALTDHRVKAGALLVGMDGDFNAARWMGPPALLNQRVLALEADALTLSWIERCLPPMLKVTNDLTYATTVKHLSSAQVAAYRVPWPRIDIRQRIADYLDYEAAEIDAFISDLSSLRRLTQERLLSEWSALFGAAAHAPHTQIRHLVTSLVDGPFGSGLTSSHYADEGAPVVRLGNIGRFNFQLEPRAYIPSAYASDLAAHAVRPGDVVIAGLGDANHPLGRSAVVPEQFGEGIVKADCYRARVNGLVSPSFLAWALSAPQTSDGFREMSRGSTRARLNLALVAAARIPVPDRGTQDRLLATYGRAEAAATQAIADITAAIALAKERRAALITAAVTGQIDVTARRKPVVDSIQSSLAEAR